LALGRKKPDDAQRHALDLDHGADRVLASAEQLLVDGPAEDDD
jgi:hypothetical protein